jgi:hypothetical protein
MTVDEMVLLRVALNNSINTLQRLINQNDSLSAFYAKELEAAKEAKNILGSILNRN